MALNIGKSTEIHDLIAAATQEHDSLARSSLVLVFCFV